MALFSYLKSTILSKVVMAATGLLMVLFLIGHMLGNLQVFIGRDAYNSYSHFLQSTGELLWVVRIVLIISLLLHIITSIRLKLLNWSAKPTKYEVKRYVNATFSSRFMFWTGIMIACFLGYHLAQFTLRITDKESRNYKEIIDTRTSLYQKIPPQYPIGTKVLENDSSKYKIVDVVKILNERHDTYKMVVKAFKVWWISLLYIVGMIILFFHLNHAFQSAFQTLGFNNPKYTPYIQNSSVWLSIILAIGFCAVPISIWLGLIGGKI